MTLRRGQRFAHSDGDDPALRPAQRLAEQHFIADQEPEAQLERALARPRRRPWLAWGLALLLLGSIGQAALWLWQLWQSWPVLAVIFAAALVLLGGGGLRALWREWRALKVLRKLERSSQQAAKADSGDQALVVLERSMKLRGQADSAAMSRFLASVSGHDNGQEVQQRFRQLVLSELDSQAQAVIRRYALEATVLVAVSPLALTDMAIVAWRNTRLTREVARVYGLQLGYWSRVRLLRQVFINMIYAGASEMAIDVGMSTLGADMLGKLSGRAAQGVGAGLLTARLGWHAMRLCRPLPLDIEEQKALSSVRRRLLLDMGKDLMKLPGMVLNRQKSTAEKPGDVT